MNYSLAELSSILARGVESKFLHMTSAWSWGMEELILVRGKRAGWGKAVT